MKEKKTEFKEEEDFFLMNRLVQCDGVNKMKKK